MNTSANNVPVVTIDGPSGSGKGTVSQRVAGEFGWHLLDSGALYRLLACAAQRDGAGLDDAALRAVLQKVVPVNTAALFLSMLTDEQVEYLIDKLEEENEELREEYSGRTPEERASLRPYWPTLTRAESSSLPLPLVAHGVSAP